MPQDPRALVQQADKLIASNSSFWSFFTGENNYEDAEKLLQEAADIYTLKGNYDEAGKALEKKAHLMLKADDTHTMGFKAAMDAYAQAANAEAAERCFALTNKKEFAVKPMAEMYEEKLGNMKKASEYYGQLVALSYSLPFAKKKWLQKQADTAALFFANSIQKDERNQPYQEDLKTALKIYSDLVQDGLQSPLIPAMVLKIAICGMAQLEEELLRRTLEQLDPFLRVQFEKAEEGILFAKLRTTWIANDLEGFARVMVWYELNADQRKRLEPWHIAMLLNVGRKTWTKKDMDAERERQKELYLAGEWKKLQNQRVQEPQYAGSYQTPQPYPTQHQRPQYQDSYPTPQPYPMQHQQPQYQESYQPEPPSPAPQPKSNQPSKDGTASAKKGGPDAEEFF